MVNNAGMVNVGMDGETFLDFIDMNDADWDLDIAMNLHTAYNVTKPVGRPPPSAAGAGS